MTAEEIARLVTEREQARKDGQYEKADKIRNRLLVHGVTLEDRPDGTTRVKR